MNRILFEAHEIQPDGTVWVTDQRFQHLRRVLRAIPGQIINTGTLNGSVGTSRVLSMQPEGAQLATEHRQPAPEPWLDLLLALPRPKVLKRLWPQLAALGVRNIVLLNAAKVEKAYFGSHWLQMEYYRPLLIEGLVQAGTSHLPQVTVAPRFKPFIEDVLTARFPQAQRLVAHPGGHSRMPSLGPSPPYPLLAIGPEGGWSDYELQVLEHHDFRRISLGARILRSDTASIALMAVLGYVYATKSEDRT